LEFRSAPLAAAEAKTMAAWADEGRELFVAEQALANLKRS